MDFTYSPKEEAFRKEVRDWLAENIPGKTWLVLACPVIAVRPVGPLRRLG